jgi:L-asparaginase/Glu-tRNA(Gln) amidotransferase subunit D
LQQVLHTHKPVVLTCAMRPATAVLQDGPQNLLDAVTVSRDPQARGVLVVAAGTVHSPAHVQKEHTYRLDALSSGPSGPLAWVESGRVRWSCPPSASQPHAHAATAVLQDGPQNLLDALRVAREPHAVGVLVVAAGGVHSAQDVQKEHPYRLDALSSGPSGPLAWVESGRVRWSRLPRLMEAHAHAATALSRPVEQWPWVAVVSSHAGVDPRQVEACVSAGVQGLVVAGTGNGTLHTDLLSALQAAAQSGVALRLCTRCAHGPIVGDHTTLPCAPRELNAFKARVSLMLDLMV